MLYRSNRFDIVVADTLYGLRLHFRREPTPLQVRALGRIVQSDGRPVTLDALLDDLIAPPGRPGRAEVVKVMPAMQRFLERLGTDNPDVIEVGDFGPAGGRAYRLKERQ